MKSLSILLLLSLPWICYAQCTTTCGANLMLNPGFELPTGSCTPADIQLYNSQTPVADWFGTDDYPSAGSSPDYFSPCAGSTNAPNSGCITGTGRVGIFTRTSFSSGREYVQAALVSPLEAGKTYCFSMVVKSRVGAAGNTLSSCDGMGAWFHNQGFINIQTMNGGAQFLGAGSPINATPQVENPSGNLIGASCVTVTGTFCAQGGESRVVIGNFRTDAATQLTGPATMNYMYIDDVQLVEVCPPDIGLTASDDSLDCGESSVLTLTSTFPPGTVYTWIEPAGNALSGTAPHTVDPSVSTTYTVVATYNGGCGPQSDTASIGIQVGPCGISADLYDTLICQGNCHDLQAYNLGGGTPPYSVEWTDNTGAVLGAATGPYTVCPVTTETYYLNVTDATGSQYHDSITITVQPFPVVDAGNDTSVCAGSTVLLTGTTDNGEDQWLTQGNLSSVPVSPLVSTHYIYQSDNNGCVSDDTVFITVNALPQLAIQTTAITCFGADNGTMTVTANGTAPFSYQWSPIAGTAADSISNLPAGTETVVVTDGNGCTALIQGVIQEPLPLQVNLTGDTVLCPGETTLLTSTVSGGTPGYGYSWQGGTGSGNSLSFAPLTSENVTLTVTDLNSCQVTSTVFITVNPVPVAAFIDGIKLCGGADTLLQNTSSGATHYTWMVNSVVQSTATDLAFHSTALGCYTIQLIAANQFGCSDSVSAPCAVEIQPTPVSSVSASKYLVFIDEPTCILFNNSTGGDSCSWYLDNQLYHIGCEATLNCSFPELGSYSFTQYVFNDFGCMDSSRFTIEVREGLIYYVPNAFTPDGDEFNNTFTPVFTSGFDPSDYRFEVYNRWGELIFESKDPSTGWDGTYHGENVQSGIYTWKISFGDLYSDERYEIAGHVSKLE